MDRIEIYQEIRSMQIAYIFHFVFYIILGIEHILMILNIFWDNNNHIKIFISCAIIDIIILFYPIIPLVLMYRIILRKKLTKAFKYISLIIILISFAIGIVINISFWFNLKATTDFSKECPYNLNDIEHFLNEEKISERCQKRRCVLESINELEGYPYNYICNYNSQNEFEIDPTKQYPAKSSDGSIYYLKYFIQCEKKTFIEELITDKNNLDEHNEIYIYLQKCWNNNDIQGFYLCQRYEYPNTFNIKDNYNCPKDNYNVILYLCGIFLIILDIIFAFIPWSLDYKTYSKLVLFDNNENENLGLDNNEQQRERHNETNTSSHNQNLNNAEGNNDQDGNGNNNQNNNLANENNGRDNENDFIHQPTETIIIGKNNSSNFKSGDRLNSGLNSNNSKSNVINGKNKRKNKNGKENIDSMISKSESHNMISKTSEKEDESEDSKIKDNNRLILNKNGDKNNEIDDINFNNNIKYDEYKNNDDEDEKDEDKKVKFNCLIKNQNININKNKNALNKNKKKIIVLTNDDRSNLNIKETNNSVRTTIVQKNKEDYFENAKNYDNSENSKEIENFIKINQNINVNNRNKTPKKELKSLNFNFSQVLTNIRDSEQNSIFNNTNGSIIKEEKKEETERTYKEEEKNNWNLSSINDSKRKNLSEQASFKIKNKSKDKQKKEEKKLSNSIKLKNDSQNSLLIENSNKSDSHSQLKNEEKKISNIINYNENEQN